MKGNGCKYIMAKHIEDCGKNVTTIRKSTPNVSWGIVNLYQPKIPTGG